MKRPALQASITTSALALSLVLTIGAAPIFAQDGGAKGKTRLQQAKPKAAATPESGPPNALQGFSQNRGEPVRIRSDTLEVHNKDNTATFRGNVQFTQGDTVMQCATLVVYYVSDGPNGSIPNGKNGQAIRRLDALGGVHVVRQEQTAQGDSGVFDMLTNTATLSGNVVITRATDVVRGQKLVVDLKTGISRIEAGGYNGGGRVEGLFQAGGRPDASSPFSSLPRN